MSAARARLGCEIELGEPQWAVHFGDDCAHFWRIHPARSGVVVTSCGVGLSHPLMYHPGTYPLCRQCAAIHAPPHVTYSAAVLAWFRWRSPAPASADRLRQP